MRPETLAASTGVGRAAFGALALTSPATIAQLGDFDLDNSSARYMARLFGARDLVLGAMTLAPRTRRFALLAGLVIDCMDIGSGVVAAREGGSTRSKLATVGGAVPFVVAGALALRSRNS